MVGIVRLVFADKGEKMRRASDVRRPEQYPGLLSTTALNAEYRTKQTRIQSALAS